jgi:hypothetical protein
MSRSSKILSVLAPCLVLCFLGTHVCFAISDCLYAGVTFSDGAVSCQSGQQFRCSDGTWVDLDLSCAAPPAGPAVINPADCSCTQEELAGCDRLGQACCVSIEFGKCVKRCCRKQ